MSLKPGKPYISQLVRRYRKAGKLEKQTILNEFVKTTGYHRKSASRILTGSYRYHTGAIQRPRKAVYTSLDAVVLKKVGKLLGWINSKRIQPQIGVAIDSLVGEQELTCLPEQKQRLVKISPATIDRLLTKHHQRPKLKGHSYTRSGTLLKTKIPIRTFADWSENKVGFEEMDLVGHDGGLAKGGFAWTLNFVDVKSGWDEPIAVLNKAQKHVFAGIKTIRERLPFPLLGYDSDSGAEFINGLLYHYSQTEKITFTRGRPGRKNDNAYIEEKNDSVIRRWVGYGRYSTQAQVDLLNELYSVLRLYLNFFLPIQKMVRKERTSSQVRRIYDRAKTPYQRILEAEEVPKEAKDNLREQYQTLNLVKLKRQVDEILRRLKPTPTG